MHHDGRYLELIARIGNWEPPPFIFGGFAEDALLHGVISRPHNDVDVLVFREQLNLYIPQAKNLGFEDFDINYEPIPGKPLVLNAEHGGLHLEISMFERDGEDKAYFVVIGGADGKLYRVYLPDDAFTFPASMIEGVPVQTLSPLALYQIRDGLMRVAPFGELRPTDLPAQKLLLERFFKGKAEVELAPQIRSEEP